jgi:hypothetical protein
VVNVASLENTTDRPILEDLRIGERVSKARLDSTQINPEFVDFTINKERGCTIIV